MQFVDRKMFTSFQEGAQDCAALFGLFQADALEMSKENSFGFADVLPRDGRLIVDSFLEHVGRRGVDTARQRVANMILGGRGLRQPAPSFEARFGPAFSCVNYLIPPPPPG